MPGQQRRPGVNQILHPTMVHLPLTGKRGGTISKLPACLNQPRRRL
jgi:hypothetical protein